MRQLSIYLQAAIWYIELVDPYPLIPPPENPAPVYPPPQSAPQGPPIQWQQSAVSPTTVRCVSCGYDLSGAAIGGVCAECGTPVERSLPSESSGRSSGLATACMVVGICALAVCMVLGPVAIVLYYRAMREMSAGGYAKASYTMAKAGLILGIISCCVLVLYVGLIAVMGFNGF